MNDSGTLPKETLSALRFMLPPLLTLILGKLLFELLAFHFPDLNDYLQDSIEPLGQQFPPEILFRESRARLLWLSSVIVYFIIYAGFFAFIWQTMARTLNRKGLLLYLGIAAIYLGAETGYMLGVADAASSPLRTIFSFTYDTLMAAGIYSPGELAVIAMVMDSINLIAFVVAPLAMLAGCSIMQERFAASMPSLDALRIKSRHLKDLLTGASAIMVTGILFMKIWLSWPLGFVSDAQLLAQLEAVTVTIAQYWGITYSLTIAALYLSSAITLSNQAREVIMAGNDADLKKTLSSGCATTNCCPPPRRNCRN